MRSALLAISASIFCVMIAVTVRSSLAMGIIEALPSYAANPWAVATLYDAYSGFLLFWLWVAWRERSWVAGGVWFLLIMALGNIATSAYVFRAAWQLKPGESVRDLLTGKGGAA